MNYMFYSCYNLENVYLTNFKNQFIYYECIFEGCNNLKSVEIGYNNLLIKYLDDYNFYYRRNEEKIKLVIK